MPNFVNEMTNALYMAREWKLKKWLLTVTLFFGIFTFSAQVGSQQSIKLLPTQTELLFSNSPKNSKQLVSYSKIFDFKSSINPSNHTKTNWRNKICVYNLVIKIRLSNILNQFRPHSFVNSFHAVKTIAQGTDEDIFCNFIG